MHDELKAKLVNGMGMHYRHDGVVTTAIVQAYDMSYWLVCHNALTDRIVISCVNGRVMSLVREEMISA